MCEYCEQPYKMMRSENDNGVTPATVSYYSVCPDMTNGPMLFVGGYDTHDMRDVSGLVPVKHCPMCGRRL